MKEKAFTLIELLVVMAIIGLLASIVLVNLRGSRDKARIGKILQFSQSINHALGAYAVGIWRFDTVESGFTPDTSGYGNPGTVNGADSTSSLSSLRNALYFDGINDSVEVPNMRMGGSMTIEFWIKPEFSYNEGTSHYCYLHWWINGDNYMRAYKHTNNKTLFVLKGDTVWRGVEKEIKFNADEWHHLAGTFDNTTGELKLYWDAELKGTVTGAESMIRGASTLYIGRAGWGDEYFKGIIDEVMIYNEALTIGQIQKHYTEGLERLKLVEK